ncbi:hypothetical protein FBQ97_01430 [Acidobacteria bacterium ACD]|nr:hypothetical protein [Acidobacteria bacterium ACD]
MALRIDPRCARLIEALRSYHYPAEQRDSLEPVKDGSDHACDALRYLVVNLDGEARPVGTALDAGADEGGRAPSRLHTLAPCRLLDTRGAAGPFGGPALPPGSIRLFLLAGRCGVPPSARALSVNLTAVLPAAAGWLGLRPAAATPPAPTSVLNFAPLRVRANNAVVSLSGDGGALAVVSGSPGAVDVILDVNGWFE